MFVNQSFTKNRTVINGKTVQIYGWISEPDLLCQKIHPLRDATFGADCLTPLTIFEIVTVGLKNGF